MSDLPGKVALVSGAGSGIGAATAQCLAQTEARVALFSRTQGELEQTEVWIDGGESLLKG